MEHPVAADLLGLLYAWWRGDPLPPLAEPPRLTIEPVDVAALSVAFGLNESDLRHRVAGGHQPYVASIAEAVVASGWSASRSATIGEHGLAVALPPGNRYLWDFVTLPEWRGRGIYPWLLQAIMRREAGAQRFWIGHDAANIASARGIARAGFQLACSLHALPDGKLTLRPAASLDRARAAASLLGVALEERQPPA